jgi:hypothetical protein
MNFLFTSTPRSFPTRSSWTNLVACGVEIFFKLLQLRSSKTNSLRATCGYPKLLSYSFVPLIMPAVELRYVIFHLSYNEHHSRFLLFRHKKPKPWRCRGFGISRLKRSLEANGNTWRRRGFSSQELDCPRSYTERLTELSSNPTSTASCVLDNCFGKSLPSAFPCLSFLSFITSRPSFYLRCLSVVSFITSRLFFSSFKYPTHLNLKFQWTTTLRLR